MNQFLNGTKLILRYVKTILTRKKVNENVEYYYDKITVDAMRKATTFSELNKVKTIPNTTSDTSRFVYQQKETNG